MSSKFWKFIDDIAKGIGLKKTLEEETKKKAKKQGLNDDETNKVLEETERLTSGYFEGTLEGDDKTFVDQHIPNSATPITQGANWLTDQIESSTGDKANEINERLGQQNYELEREKFDYDKALQQKIFEREDTANQRTVNDMRLAGLNPLNMQGTNGAGEAIATTAPQNKTQVSATKGLEFVDMLFNTALSAKSTMSNNSLQQAQANLLNAQANNQRIKNKYESDILSNTLTDWRYKNTMNYFNQEDAFHNYQFNQMMGWTKDMPDWLKLNSAKFDYNPISYKPDTNLPEILSKPDSHWHKLKCGFHAELFPDIHANLLADELLTGSMGVLGSLFKMLK